MRGRFTPGAGADEWCERRLLARIHHYTVKRLRAEIEPVAARDFLRFLLELAAGGAGRADGRARCGRRRRRPARRLRGAGRRVGERDPAGAARRLRAGLARRPLPGRTGRLGAAAAAQWTRQRQRAPRGAGAHHADHAAGARARVALGIAVDQDRRGPSRAPGRKRSSISFGEHGASFFDELVDGTGLLRTQVEEALAELVALGLVSSDSFGGLRALLVPSASAGRWRSAAAGAHRDLRHGGGGPLGAGAPSAARAGAAGRNRERSSISRARCCAATAWCSGACSSARPTGCRRGATCCASIAGSKRAARSAAAGSWPAFPGEQFALPDAIGLLREVRRKPETGAWVSLSGADPLNLAGILTPGAEACRPDRQPSALPGRHPDRAVRRRRGAISRNTRCPPRNGRRARRCCGAPRHRRCLCRRRRSQILRLLEPLRPVQQLHRLVQGRGSRRDRVRLCPFFRRMALAVAAGHEQHRARRDPRHKDGIMPGAGRERHGGIVEGWRRRAPADHATGRRRSSAQRSKHGVPAPLDVEPGGDHFAFGIERDRGTHRAAQSSPHGCRTPCARGRAPRSPHWGGFPRMPVVATKWPLPRAASSRGALGREQHERGGRRSGVTAQPHRSGAGMIGGAVNSISMRVMPTIAVTRPRSIRLFWRTSPCSICSSKYPAMSERRACSSRSGSPPTRHARPTASRLPRSCR